MTNAEARFNKSLRPRKPEGSLGRTAQDVHLDSHTAPELWREKPDQRYLYPVSYREPEWCLRINLRHRGRPIAREVNRLTSPFQIMRTPRTYHFLHHHGEKRLSHSLTP